MKETLEEAAEWLYPIFDRFKYDEDWVEDVTKSRQDFIEGAKWQQERSYSEEDIKIAFTEGHNSARIRGSYKFNGTFEEDWILWFKQFKKK
jgi:hypothetical protein